MSNDPDPKSNLPPVVPPGDPDRPILLEGWLMQVTEWTKSIFALSSAAIALIATLLMAPDAKQSPETKMFVFLSALSFAIAVFSCISAFTESANLIKALLTLSTCGVENQKVVNERAADAQKALVRLKLGQQLGFGIGLGLLLVGVFFHVIKKT